MASRLPERKKEKDGALCKQCSVEKLWLLGCQDRKKRPGLVGASLWEDPGDLELDPSCPGPIWAGAAAESQVLCKLNYAIGPVT